ncbi:hypothetical protein [Hansschlegelia zhihuaiae]|uniref:Uncharacterized protein n=1 Tax=Hansschlegelia zhihuaiae TaxID=405005 RepID=A0A4Q0M2T3_9HYPH|nr:hypothetical protein [Hansschlegelia zhihuaiae]RXF66959.1 hypothetical protein EK403_21940 [Hansschlegelia zhihuaiae]
MAKVVELSFPFLPDAIVLGRLPSAQYHPVLDGFINWKNGQLFYSDSFSACPYKPIFTNEISNIVVRDMYHCITGDQMWSATIFFKRLEDRIRFCSEIDGGLRALG